MRRQEEVRVCDQCQKESRVIIGQNTAGGKIHSGWIELQIPESLHIIKNYDLCSISCLLNISKDKHEWYELTKDSQ